MASHYFAILSRMKYINRWGLMRNTREENLSEHSLETAFIAHALCTLGNRRLGKILDAEQAAVQAMFHDTTEILTGDMPTPVKYDNDELKTAYKSIEEQAAKKLLCYLPKDLKDDYKKYYEESGEISEIVHAADKISAYIKCIEEEKMGNGEFLDAKESIKKAIDGLDIPEVKLFMEEFIDSYGLTLDKQRS